MSNLIPTNVQLPAHLQNYRSELTEQTDTIKPTSALPLRIGRAGTFKAFRLIEEGQFGEPLVDPNTRQHLQEMRIIIIGKHDGVKSYFEGEYESDGERTRPTCWSHNRASHPDMDVMKPQSFTCQSCKWDVFGSDKRNTKKCSDQSNLAAIIPDPKYAEIIAAVWPKGGDLINLEKYWKEMKANGYPIEYSFTLLGFDPSLGHPRFNFSFGGFLDENWVKFVNYIRDNNKAEIDTVLGKGREPMTLEVFNERSSQPAVTLRNEPAPVQQPAPTTAPPVQQNIPSAPMPPAPQTTTPMPQPASAPSIQQTAPAPSPAPTAPRVAPPVAAATAAPSNVVPMAPTSAPVPPSAPPQAPPQQQAAPTAPDGSSIPMPQATAAPDVVSNSSDDAKGNIADMTKSLEEMAASLGS